MNRWDSVTQLTFSQLEVKHVLFEFCFVKKYINASKQGCINIYGGMYFKK